MTMFGTNTKLNNSVRDTLEQGDHTELDTSELLDNGDKQKYKSVIGYLQWDIYLGRFEICTHVMKMSSFRSAPVQGHMEWVKRINEYLHKMRN